MKIVFICGSLEIGRDGVGDYTRRLAAQVIRQGHRAIAIALHEDHIQSSSIEKQFDEEVELRVLRIPAAWNTSRRFEEAKKTIANFSPDWISLQFVPYSFNSKGICFGLEKHLKALDKDAKWHIMFHELWIGRDKHTGLKEWMVSKLQKVAIKSIGNRIKPAVIHTQLPVFYSKLNKFGWNVKRLPLFANLQVTDRDKNEENNIFRIGFFSQVETGEAMMHFLDALALQILSKNMQIEVLLIGGSENRMKENGKILESLKNLNSNIKYTGFLQPDALAKAIESCDMGITPIPRHALGKSGSVAAFISYGIPVAAPNVHFFYEANDIGFFTDDLRKTIITNPNLNEWKEAKRMANIAKNEILLSRVTESFLMDLGNNNNNIN